MEPRAHHVLVGLFVVLGIGAGLLFSLWLAQPGGGEDTDTYAVVFSEPVTGLTVGSAVRYSGIQVGRVEALRLDPQDPRKVRALIQLRDEVPIKPDTRAQLRMAGITGGAEIHLRGGSPESPPLTRSGDQVPAITAEPSPLARLAGGSEQLVDRVLRLLERGDQLLSPENIRNLSATLENLERTSGAVAERREAIGQTIENMHAASAEARRAIEETAQVMRRTSALLDKRGEPLLDDAIRTMAALERTSGRLERLLRENEGALRGGMQALRNVGPALQELRAALASLREISRRLEQNPRDYLFGGDEVEEFQP